MCDFDNTLFSRQKESNLVCDGAETQLPTLQIKLQKESMSKLVLDFVISTSSLGKNKEETEAEAHVRRDSLHVFALHPPAGKQHQPQSWPGNFPPHTDVSGNF